MMNIDKTAMLTGWLMGRKVAEMMKPQDTAQWETTFDGEVTTATLTDGNVAVHMYNSGMKGGVNSGKTYRLTVDGAVYIMTSTDTLIPYSSYWLGNPHLFDAKAEDNGYDFALKGQFNVNSMFTYFYTRTPGTYKLKIEKLVETTK